MRARVLENEWMDDPKLDRDAHIQALRGLSRIYAASRSGAAVWPHIRRMAQAADGPLRVLDIATGGGDFPLDLARRSQREGLSLEVTGCDISPRAIAFARLRARQTESDARFITLDADKEQIPEGYHVLTSGLFLHHLTEPQSVALLRKMAGVAARAVLVDDLRRSLLGLWLARLATRVLSRSPVVHVDGPRSVRAAFTTVEFRGLAHAAGLTAAVIVPHWPARHLLVWERSSDRVVQNPCKA